jgi:hypothetical protein
MVFDQVRRERERGREGGREEGREGGIGEERRKVERRGKQSA